MRLTAVENQVKLLCLSSFNVLLQYLPLQVLYRTAEFSAELTYRLDRGKRQMMQQELAALGVSDYTPGQIGQIVKKGLSTSRKDIFEEIKLVADLSPANLRKLSYFEGRQYLDDCLTQGKGVIILLTHFGFRKLLIPALGFAGYTVNQVATHPHTLLRENDRDAVHNKMMDLEFQFDRACPAHFIYVENFLRPIYHSLANNELVIFTIDGPVGLKRVKVPFFQRHILLPPSPFSLGLKNTVPLLPVFVVRQTDNRHKIMVEKPLPMQTGDGEKISEMELIRKFVHLLETYVRRYPGHYVDYLYRSRLNPITKNLHVFE
jgi:lauroyl/myristoyl acyltransferase